MSMDLIHQQQQQQYDDFHSGMMMPSVMSQQHNYGYQQQQNSNNDYHQQNQPYPPVDDLASSCSMMRQQSSSTQHYIDQEQYPSYDEFEAIVQDYLLNLSSKKRDKALIDQERYAMILQVLKDPRNTAVSTAQFRFWVKKMFQLTTSRQIVCHDGKPVAMREQIYGILVRAHREAHHGGRDKTSSLVRRRYSWIPKELIARFVRHCPFCISRRNGSQQNPLSLGIFLPATPPTYSMMPSSSIPQEVEEGRIRAPSMMTSTSSNSSCSYPDEMMLMVAAAAAASHDGSSTTLDLSSTSWQQTSNQHDAYYAVNYYNKQQQHNTHDYSKYSMTYHHPMKQQESIMMQPPLSVYNNNYAAAVQEEEYELKHYSSTDPKLESNINPFVAPVARTYATTTAVMPSPSLSPSSSSTSAASSPVHPAYHENADHTWRLQHPHNTQQGLNFLSHHQSLF